MKIKKKGDYNVDTSILNSFFGGKKKREKDYFLIIKTNEKMTANRLSMNSCVFRV